MTPRQVLSTIFDMNYSILTEIVGALAAFLVFISYSFKDQRKLRIFGIIAGFIFIAYGLQIAYMSDWTNGWTTVFLNLSCIIMNSIRLMKNDKNNN